VDVPATDDPLMAPPSADGKGHVLVAECNGCCVAKKYMSVCTYGTLVELPEHIIWHALLAITIVTCMAITMAFCSPRYSKQDAAILVELVVVVYGARAPEQLH